MYIYIPGTQMSLVLIGKDLLLEAKQRTNGFQVCTLSLFLYLQHGLNLTTHHNPLFCWHARLNFNVGSGEFIGLMSPT